ncbi:DNA recombinase, partial [Pseudomonas aeruginosa]|nr:DNA recombinase [Pseudomonas aeruginosa]
MGNLTTIQNEIFLCENRFNAVNAFKLNFKREASFALQLLGNNSFLLGVATENPASLENAISNLAAIGISLNPATKEAYLVPRSRAVCLDISAIGLIKL